LLRGLVASPPEFKEYSYAFAYSTK
jgi:hypothetical protein